MIKPKFNIQDSAKTKKFIGVCSIWGCDAKGLYAKMTIKKDVKKFVEGYENYTGSDIKVQRIPSYPSTNLSKSDLEEPKDIDKYSSFVEQLM